LLLIDHELRPLLHMYPKGVRQNAWYLLHVSVMRLKFLGLIAYHVKIEFLLFNLLSSSFLTNLIALYVYQ